MARSTASSLVVFVCLVAVTLLDPVASISPSTYNLKNGVHEIYVAPGGRDGEEGSLLHPVASLAGARNLIREIKVLYHTIKACTKAFKLLLRIDIDVLHT